MEPKPDPAVGAPVKALISLLVRALGNEVRLTLSRLLVGLTAVLLTVVTSIVLSVAGALRLGDALSRACARWLGDPILGDALVGLGLMGLPLIVVLLLWWRLRR